MNNQQYIYLVVPLIFSSIVSYICPMIRNDNVKSAGQPPGWIFGVIWPILYLFIGYTWMISRQSNSTISDILFISNLLCINAWLFFFNCQNNKLGALWTFIPSIATSLMCLIFVSNVTSNWWPAILLAPYISWLIFASQLNMNIVTN